MTNPIKETEIEIMSLHEKLDGLRHREIVAMHDTVRQVAARLEHIEAKLSGERP